MSTESGPRALDQGCGALKWLRFPGCKTGGVGVTGRYSTSAAGKGPGKAIDGGGGGKGSRGLIA